MSPAVTWKATLNNNIFTHPAVGPAYYEAVQSGKFTFSPATPTGPWFYDILELSQYRYKVDRFYDDPFTTIGYPVFDSFDTLNRKVTGLIAATLYWRVYFLNILPSKAKGILVVFDNPSYNQTFSYRIDGDSAQFLGYEDFHEDKFDSYKKSASMAKTLQEIRSPETQAFTAVDVNENFGNYDIYIYPSQDTEDVFVNDEPIYYTVTIVCIFLFTSLVFVAYDCIVARRQRILMERALASGAIVSSLFPSQVRKQMYAEQNTSQLRTSGKLMPNASSSSGNGEFRRGLGKEEALGGDSKGSNFATRPIASEYKETTVFFCDLVGFTAWSSKRTPVEVFELLEALYSEFDAIAKRRKVFKIETVSF